MPSGTCEQNKERQKLQPSEKHQERCSQFGMHTIACIVFNGSDRTKSGADITDAGEGSGQIGRKVLIASERHDKTAHQHKRDIHESKLRYL